MGTHTNTHALSEVQNVILYMYSVYTSVSSAVSLIIGLVKGVGPVGCSSDNNREDILTKGERERK